MSIFKLFPTHVYTKRLAPKLRTRLNRELVGDTLKLEKFDQEGKKWSMKNYKGGYTSYNSLYQLHQQFSAFSRLEEFLEPHIRAYAKSLQWNLGQGRLKMTTCWTSRMPRNVYHTMHTHPLAVISGTYYAQVPPGTSALKIEDPRLGFMMAAPPRKATAPQSQQNYVHLAPEAGRFYLFESWLRHEVPPNPVDGDRISVSFNYEWV
jgi:uncharacterized protein (TIGR02466 family)